jgi:Flp pilus assembly protein TadB
VRDGRQRLVVLLAVAAGVVIASVALDLVGLGSDLSTTLVIGGALVLVTLVAEWREQRRSRNR